MKIKKFDAASEQAALEKVKGEFGPSALILNIRKVQPKGIFRLFKKPVVEVTAALDEKGDKGEKAEPARKMPETLDNSGFDGRYKEDILREKRLLEQSERIKSLEEKLNTTSGMLERVTKQLSVTQYEKKQMKQAEAFRYQNNLVQIFYDALIEEEVIPEIAHEILSDIDALCEDQNKNEDIDINLIVKIVYTAIINILGEVELLDYGSLKRGSPKILAFIGNTGVGKTTTIAKLSAEFILNRNLSISLVTADTYRIAAVEQLKIYADILGVDVAVAYSPEDLEAFIELYSPQSHLLLLDTAGRSHKNAEALTETESILNAIPGCKKYLVLSLTTKYEDLLDIIEAYSFIADFSIIFTKLDETRSYGSILNVCYKTGRKIAYVTAGQNVPEDIDVLRPDKIAKALLGLGE